RNQAGTAAPVPAELDRGGRPAGPAADHEHRHAGSWRVAHGRSAAGTIGVRIPPSRSISTSTTSPGVRNHGGVRTYPTPSGVPVAITSPGSRVRVRLIRLSRSGTVKIMSLVVPSCTVSPLTR